MFIGRNDRKEPFEKVGKNLKDEVTITQFFDVNQDLAQIDDDKRLKLIDEQKMLQQAENATLMQEKEDVDYEVEDSAEYEPEEELEQIKIPSSKKQRSEITEQYVIIIYKAIKAKINKDNIEK